MYGLTTGSAVFSHPVVMNSALQQHDYHFGWKALLFVGVFVVCNVTKGALEKHGGFWVGGFFGSIALVASLLSALTALLFFFAMVAS